MKIAVIAIVVLLLLALIFGSMYVGRRNQMVVKREAVSASFSADGRRVVTASADRTARIWRVYTTTQELIDHGKEVVPRCLTQEQREKAFLDPAPPPWCVEMEKWPYHTQDWKDWLKFKRANASPPLPDTPEWQPWLALRSGEDAK